MPGPFDEYVPEGMVDAALPGWRQGRPWAPAKPVEPQPEKTPSLFEQAGQILGRPQQAAFELVPGQGGPGAAVQQLIGGIGLPWGQGPLMPELPQRGFEERFLQGLPEGLPRTALGIGADLLEDPINFIPFGLIGKAAKGRKLVEAGAAATEATRVGPELIKPVSFASALEGIEAPGRVGQAVRDVANKKRAGALREVGNLIAPAVVAEGPLDQKLLGYERSVASASQASRATVLGVSQQMGPWKGLDADARLTLADGSKVGFTDISEQGLIGSLDAEAAQRLGAHQSLVRQALDMRDASLRELEAVSPEVAQNYREFSEIKLPEVAGAAYSPRVFLREGTKLGGLGGLKKGAYEFEREFNTMEKGLEAIAEGKIAGRYLGPDETLRVFLEAVYKDTALIDFTVATLKDPKIMSAQRDWAGIKALAQGAKEAGEQADVANQVNDLLRHVLQKRQLPWQQLAKIREANPELGAKLDEALAISLPDAIRAAKAGVNITLKGTRVTRERFIADLEAVRAALREKRALTHPLGLDTLPTAVKRFDSAGDPAPTTAKPHGLYTTPAQVESPHADLGPQSLLREVNPAAKVLTGLDLDQGAPVRRGAITGASAGVAALRALLGVEETARLAKLGKKALQEHAEASYPAVNWGLYYDVQELLEGLGGLEARKRGYDAIWGFSARTPKFSEFVALTEKAFLPEGKGQVRPKVPKPPKPVEPPPLVDDLPEDALSLQEEAFAERVGDFSGDFADFEAFGKGTAAKGQAALDALASEFGGKTDLSKAQAALDELKGLVEKKASKDDRELAWSSFVDELDSLELGAVPAQAAEAILPEAPKVVRKPALHLEGKVSPGELTQVLQDLHGENYQFAREARLLFEYILKGQIAHRREALMAVGREARNWKKETGLAKMEAGNVLTAAKAAGTAATEGIGLEQPKFQRLQGMWLQPADVKRLEDAIEPRAHPGLSWLASGPAASRAILTTMDLGAWAYQGLARLASNPRDTLYGMYRMALAAMDPETHLKYLGKADNQQVMRDMPDLAVLGGGMGENEIFQAAPQMADWFRTHLGRPGKVAASIFDRGQASFEALGDTVRLEWAKSTIPAAKRADKLKEMAAVINHGTGVMAPRVGISLNQKAIEQMLVFAPNYTRSAFALVGDMLQGGVAGREAQTTVANMLMVGAFMYNKAATMLGQDPILDPADSRFMSVQLPGTEERVSIGGVWIALARLAARSTTNRYTGELDLSQLTRLDGDNPLLRFWKGRMPVGVGTVFDLAMNESYDDLPLDQLPGLGFHIGSSFLPMAVQGYWIEAGRHVSGQGGRLGLGELALQTGATLGGLNRPERSIQDVMDSVAAAKFHKPYEELLPQEQAQVRASPEVKRLPAPMGPRGERARSLDSAFTAQGDVLGKAAAQVDAGEMTKGQFRAVAADESIKLGARLEDVEKRTPSKVPTTDPRELARKQYFEILRNADLGELRFQQADEFYSGLPEGYQGYIDDKQLGAAELVGGRAASLMKELVRTRRSLKEYWDVRTQVLERMGIKDEVLRLNPQQTAKFEDSRLGLRVRQQVDNVRERLRRQDPILDAGLVEWGYVKQPIRGPRRRPLPPAPLGQLG